MLKIKKIGEFELQLEQLGYNNGDEITHLVDQKIKLFQKNPHDTRLRNHALTKRMKGKFAFSITGDIRIIYVWLGKSTVRFLAIGGHKKVYGRSM